MPGFGPRPIDLGNPVADHPLNQGLVAWYLPLPNNSGGSRLFDLLGRNHGTLTNGPTWTAGPNGRGAVACTGTGQYVAGARPVDQMLPLSAGTVVLLQRKRDTTLRSSSAFGTTAADPNGPRVNCHLPWSDGTVYWDWAGDNTGSTRLAVSGLSFDTGWHLWAFSVGAGMRMYRDGVLVGSNANTPTRSADAANVLDLNRFGSAGIAGDLADYGGLWLYDRQLSDGAVAALYDQWQRGHPDTLRRFTPRLWSFAPAGGGTPQALRLQYRKVGDPVWLDITA